MTHDRPGIGLNVTLIEMEDPLRAKAACFLHYIDAIVAAGGVPVMIPPYEDSAALDRALEIVDGFCFVGGPDYDPKAYGGHAQTPDQLVHPRRHRFDLLLAERVFARASLPVLGVCGGQQLLNIALGGALVQDITNEWSPAKGSPTLVHAASERVGTPFADNQFRHEVLIASSSRLARIVGSERLITNSYHHQAVDPQRIGRGLIATAWTADGVIEAVESADGRRFVLGVQWHPERLQNEESQRQIFSALVNAARKL